jgi:RNA polymerase sigma-70 factor (ECF subfamily)
MEALFKEHHGAVYRAAYRITGDAMDAEDVLQTVFTRLLRRDEPLDPDAGAGSYLHRAAINAALDLMRRKKRSRAVDLDEVQDELAEDTRRGPEGRHTNRELGRRLRDALARLSPRQAEVFALRYLEGLGNVDIARLLGSSQTAIAVILFRARLRLREELGTLEGELS